MLLTVQYCSSYAIYCPSSTTHRNCSYRHSKIHNIEVPLLPYTWSLYTRNASRLGVDNPRKTQRFLLLVFIPHMMGTINKLCHIFRKILEIASKMMTKALNFFQLLLFSTWLWLSNSIQTIERCRDILSYLCYTHTTVIRQSTWF